MVGKLDDVQYCGRAFSADDVLMLFEYPHRFRRKVLWWLRGLV